MHLPAASFLTLTLTPTPTSTLPSAQAVVAFLLIGVENIGVQIEQPFSVLPLELFCSIIKTNVMEMLAVSACLPPAPLAARAALSLPRNDSMHEGCRDAAVSGSSCLPLRA